MDNPLLTRPRSVLDFTVVQGMSEHERIIATARMERAMLLPTSCCAHPAGRAVGCAASATPASAA